MGFREWPTRLCGVLLQQKGWKTLLYRINLGQKVKAKILVDWPVVDVQDSLFSSMEWISQDPWRKIQCTPIRKTEVQLVYLLSSALALQVGLGHAWAWFWPWSSLAITLALVSSPEGSGLVNIIVTAASQQLMLFDGREQAHANLINGHFWS